jgi:hypothetical protein
LVTREERAVSSERTGRVSDVVRVEVDAMVGDLVVAAPLALVCTIDFHVVMQVIIA